MSIAIVFNQKQTEEWENQLKKLLPNEVIEIYPNISDYKNVEFIATWKPSADVFLKFPNLKCIQSVGAGIDQLLGLELPKNVEISRIVDHNLAQDMFEHVLTCIMNSIKNFSIYQTDQLEKKWEPKDYSSIKDINVTILGLGQIGQLVASKLVQLGFKVRGWSNSIKAIDGVESFVGEEQLKDALDESDFVINILPLTSKTKRILNKELFIFLDKAVLINIGRGKHLNEGDLLNAFNLGHLKEAYLDVFDIEPLTKDHIFWKNPNIRITPHVASITNPTTAILQVVENYKRLKSNKKLLNIVDLTREY